MIFITTLTSLFSSVSLTLVHVTLVAAVKTIKVLYFRKWGGDLILNITNILITSLLRVVHNKCLYRVINALTIFL